MALPATDSFSQSTGGAQALTTYSSNWSYLEGTFTVPSGANRTDGDSAGYNTARWNADTFSDDQYAQVKWKNGFYVGPAVRCQSGSNTSYHVDCNGSNYYLSKCDAGAQSTLVFAETMSLSDGDIVRLEVTTVTGNAVLKVFRALAASPTTFVQFGSDYTDSSSPILTAGYAGIFAYDPGAGAGLTDFEGGNLGGGGGGVTVKTLAATGVG